MSDKLYSPLGTPQVPTDPIADGEVSENEATVFGQTTTQQLYASIVPEKPNILAEERIFVYVPKVSPDNAGIAKFVKEQFNVVNGVVSINLEMLMELILLATPSGVQVSAEPPTRADVKMWYKVVGDTPGSIQPDDPYAPNAEYDILSGGIFTEEYETLLSGGVFTETSQDEIQGGTFI